MRRKTFESFGSKPLLDRTNIIITRDEAYQAKDSIVVHTIDEALQAAGEAEEVMVIAAACRPAVSRLFAFKCRGRCLVS